MSLVPREYSKAGRITTEVRALIEERVRPGASFLEICDMVRKEVESRGGRLAFPTGIGANQVTAHYAPQGDDRSVFQESDILKVDFGVHVDGYVTDTATTITYNPEHELLLDAARQALDAAVSTARHDPRTGEIGREIKRTAGRFGFKTIENLTGHTLDRYVVHAGKSIPNLYMPGMPALKEGDVFAIEPFVTPGNAAGYVIDSPSTTIFSLVGRKKTGFTEADRFAEKVWEERKTLPFTPRWYAGEFGAAKVKELLHRLVGKRVARGYPTLVEASGSPVAQFERTLALEKGGLVVLT